MGQVLSLVVDVRNELGLSLQQTYQTKFQAITTLKVQPGGHLLLAGNEVGTLILFDASLNSHAPRHVVALTFDCGGVSEICWLNSHMFAVGTTRGRIVTFSIRNEFNHMMELSNVKAHGDGAAQIAVESLDYSEKLQCLASVAEGVGSVRLWNVSDDGILTRRLLPKQSTAYCTPRYVSFFQDGSQLLVAFMEQSLLQVFSVATLEIKAEHTLGQEDGCNHQSQLGNALLLDSMDQLVVYNLRDGCSFYAFPKMIQTADSARLPRLDGSQLCSQGITSMRNGNYIASVSNKGIIKIFRSKDGNWAGSLKLPGRKPNIQAIHAAPGHQDLLVAAWTTADKGGPSNLTVWQNKEKGLMQHPNIPREHSNLRIALLCLVVCFAQQIAVSLLPAGYINTMIAKSAKSSSLSSLTLSSNNPSFTVTVTTLATFSLPPQETLLTHLPATSVSHPAPSNIQYEIPASTPPTESDRKDFPLAPASTC